MDAKQVVNDYLENPEIDFNSLSDLISKTWCLGTQSFVMVIKTLFQILEI